MGKAMEKGAQSYPGQVLAAGGTLVSRGRDANVHGWDASCPWAGCKCPWAGRKLPAGGTRAGLQAVQPAFQKHLSGEDRRRYVSHFLVLRY